MKPTLKEIEDNYERVLLRLHSGELAGIIKDAQPQLQVLRKTHWIDKAITTADLDKTYYRKCAITDFNIDAIAFMNDADEVDYYINNYDPKTIGWDWDINNPHNLKFKKGDVVVIDHAENRSAYVRMLGKVGTIVDAEYTRYIDDERITYRVRVDDSPNEYQENGLWVFHKEKSLKLYNPQCDDQMDAYEYAIHKLGLNNNPYNRDYIIKGEKNNMFNDILEIYEEKQSKKINKKYDDLEKSIKLTDARYKMWKECVDTLDKLYAEDKVAVRQYADIELSEDTKKKLQVLYTTREQDLRKLLDKKHEVNAQLSMCETYDQKQEILRRYNIINKNGKVNG
jgi:hypothetical protein